MGGDQDYSVVQDIARMGAAANLLSAMLGRENAPRYQLKYAAHTMRGCPARSFVIPLKGHESKAAWEAALRQQIATVDAGAQVGSAANKDFVYIRSSPAFIETLKAKAKESGFASNFCDTFLAAVDAAQKEIEAKKAAARAAEASGRKDPEQVSPTNLTAPQLRFRRPERPDWWYDRTDGSFQEESPGSSLAR